ncbi:outer membrane protein assembly factor BamE [Noviherbaspirillum pedocola]|uniref:Outer membrane protein assembly factor BamE n=1 Tax=Noviherbaspirillum pedocola TaxID=2801341 RepID=A0A934W711_9BURK|nr:outer membrane protein assembly factor BamE [Noviherbaspirillum pedocola]MBK4736842.1 outer membrane protein assembly factor BamE [Noviherbaspirillum pedocola]
MKTGLFALLALLGGLLCFGCDREGRPIQEFGLDKLTRGQSTEMDVRTVMGQPESVWEENDGSRVLEYPRGPEGYRTWMFTIDSQGKLVDWRQALTPENFARVRPGMTKEEVRRLLGKPRTVAEFALKNEEVWDWRYLDATQKPQLFNVHFDRGTGRVTGTSASPDPKTNW